MRYLNEILISIIVSLCFQHVIAMVSLIVVSSIVNCFDSLVTVDIVWTAPQTGTVQIASNAESIITKTSKIFAWLATAIRPARGICNATRRASASANRELPARNAIGAKTIITSSGRKAARVADAAKPVRFTTNRRAIRTPELVTAKKTSKANDAENASSATSIWTRKTNSDARRASATATRPNAYRPRATRSTKSSRLSSRAVRNGRLSMITKDRPKPPTTLNRKAWPQLLPAMRPSTS